MVKHWNEMTLDELEVAAKSETAPFDYRMVVNTDGQLALWPVLVDVDCVPQYLFSFRLREAYIRYIRHMRGDYKVDLQ
jgi:uncharacterized protein YbdZ (MbtH family)